MEIGTEYLRDMAERLKSLRNAAERAVAQVDDHGFFAAPDAETNSIAINLKHVGGNLRSRMTDFLTSDGEKPDRDRDGEFIVEDGETRADIEAAWAGGWEILERELAALTADDLLRTIHIRGEPHTVLGALNRHLSHLAIHTGQIVLLAKHYAGDAWQTLSIPRGQSKTYRP
ncbi:DUF1572 family protein [Longimicrobium sp.]|uniref:DUF1572 family protein n=1 Tax=Longimicrobium sp. TaxID=2029185 RepID=UPI002C473990|nr:DUF1572 family protein [Longimicrobium sp.]HSU14608.1 DUF1572 family protein [Longimicrobium sp.]